MNCDGTWNKVQAQLAANTRGTRSRPNVKEPSLLSGLLFDDGGHRLFADHAVKSGRRYRSYVVRRDEEAEGDTGGSTFRISASEIEPIVIRQLTGFLGRTGEVIAALDARQLGPDAVRALMAEAGQLASELDSGSGSSRREILVGLVERITAGASSVEICLKRTALAARLLGDADAGGVVHLDRGARPDHLPRCRDEAGH